MSTRNYIVSGLARVKEFYDLPDPGLFPIWALTMIHFDGAVDDEAVLEDVYNQTQALLEEGGPGDHCLDGYFHDDERNELFLYQFKYPASENAQSGVEAAREVGMALAYLYQHSKVPEVLHESRRAAALALATVLKEHGTITLRGITASRWDTDHTLAVRNLIPSQVLDAATVHIELLGGQFFLDLEAARTANLADEAPITFRLYADICGKLLELPNQGASGLGRGITTVISAYSLADVTDKWGTKLFDQNVRGHLGTQQVNRELLKALQSDDGRKSFWYGNNGITILCNALEYEQSSDGEMVGLVVTNPQIVNGCQTSMAIKDGVGANGARKPPLIDFGVLARFILLEGRDEARADAANQIALKTNTQALVTFADLRSNDRLQKIIASRLKLFGDRWFYVRKRGDLVALRKNKAALAQYREQDNDLRLIEPQGYQQAWRAYTGQPADAVSNKGAVWQDLSLYSRVFAEDRRAADIVMVTTMLDWFARVFASDHLDHSLAVSIHPGLEDHVRKLRKAKMRCAAHALALFGRAVIEAYGSVDAYPEAHAMKIIASLKRGSRIKAKWVESGPARSWEVLELAIRLICRSLAQYCYHEVDRRNKEERADITLYAQLKKPQALDDLWQELRSERQVSFKELVTPQ